MASFSRKTGIIGALVIAGVLVVGSVLITNNGFAFLDPNTANAESTQALLKAYAAKDTDNDGLPDWEEALYGLDPNNAHSFSPNVTDGEAVAQGLVKPKFVTQTDTSTASSTNDLPPGISAAPGSITEQFSQTLFSDYMTQSAQNGSIMSDTDIDTFAQQEMQTFAQNHANQSVYGISNVRVSSANGVPALTTYAAAAQAAFAANTTTTTENGIDYFSDYVEKNDTSALIKVAAIGVAYTNIGHAMIAIPVPSEAQYAHLEISNALINLGVDFTNMSTMSSDPLRAYLGLSNYQTDAGALTKGFLDMNRIFQADSVTIPQGDPGHEFLNTCSLAEAAQTTP
jgi:hypothetical protein